MLGPGCPQQCCNRIRAARDEFVLRFAAKPLLGAARNDGCSELNTLIPCRLPSAAAGPVDPRHDFDSITTQVFGKWYPGNQSGMQITMNGFAEMATDNQYAFVMSAFNSSNLPGTARRCSCSLEPMPLKLPLSVASTSRSSVSRAIPVCSAVHAGHRVRRVRPLALQVCVEAADSEWRDA